MAERLPGLIDPNLPADKQPLNDSSLPTIPPRQPLPVHPDRFTAGAADQPVKPAKPKTPDAGAGTGTEASPSAKPVSKPAQNPEQPAATPDARPESTQPPASTKPEGIL